MRLIILNGAIVIVGGRIHGVRIGGRTERLLHGHGETHSSVRARIGQLICGNQYGISRGNSRLIDLDLFFNPAAIFVLEFTHPIVATFDLSFHAQIVDVVVQHHFFLLFD